MKNYIWERSLKRTCISTHYNEFNEGILNVTNFIRLSDGETRDIWTGFSGDFSDKDKEMLTVDKYLLPSIYFYLKDSPYFKYEKEPEVVEKVVSEKNINIQNYLSWIDLDSTRENTEKEYKKSAITKEWQEWQKQNELFFQKIGVFVSEFNDQDKKESHFNYKMCLWDWDNERGILCLSIISNLTRLYDTQIQIGLTKEKREEIQKISLEIFSDFGEFLRNKFINS